MMTWDEQFCSLALGLIVYDYYSAVATNTTTYASGGGNATDDFLSAHSVAAEPEQGHRARAMRDIKRWPRERNGWVGHWLSSLNSVQFAPLNKQYLYLPLGSVSRISSP
jgi:hypothetical protein